MDVKKCSKCKLFFSKSKFHKDRTTRDGYRPSCQICTNQYYYDNRNRLLNDNKIYRKNNRYKINAYERDKRKSDSNFKLYCSIRQRTKNAFKSQTIEKINNLIGCSNYFFRKWIIHQLYGDMTLQNYGKIWCLDHTIPLSKINGNDMYKYTNWINIRPMYFSENSSKGDKIDHRLYLMQEIKAKYFLKLNNDQQGLN